MKKVAVIGAGIAGLTCAYNLKKKGYDVEVFEKEAFVGGRMSTRITAGGYALDIGANHLANVYTHMRVLACELGLTWKPMEFLTYRIVHNGKIVPLLSDLSPHTKRRLAWQAFWGTRKKTDFFDLSTAAKYDTNNAEHFAKKKISDEAYDYILDPFTSTYQFHRGRGISLGVVWAMIRSHYTAKRDWDLHQLVGGMRALPQALANKLTVHLSSPVKRVVPSDTGVIVDTDKGSQLFDAAVLASTASVTKQIYPTATEGQKAALDGTEYATTIMVAFEIPEGTLEKITIVWVPYAESQAISGYTHEAMKGAPLIKNKKTLVLVWLHEAFAKTLIDKTDEEIYAQVKKEFLNVCPLVKDASTVVPHDLQRWPEAMPVFQHGHLSHVKKFLDRHQGEQNVFFAGDYLNAPWTEGALRCGERVADDVDRALSKK